MKTTTTLPGIIRVEATATVTVSYDAHFNMIELIEKGKIIRSEIAPRGYTAAAFVKTIQRVRDYYRP